jgi:hypothetical protein
MSKSYDAVDGLFHEAPCTAPWQAMVGDEPVRHCMSCDLNVYNFAEMTRFEVNELLAQPNNRVCARLHRRPDGTLLTRDNTSEPAGKRPRLSSLRVAVAAALVSLSAFGSGCASKSGLAQHVSSIAIEVEQPLAQHPAFSGVVRDVAGSPLPGVTIVLRPEVRTLSEITVVTDVNGAFTIAVPEDGTYRLEVILAGFGTAVREHLLLRGSCRV